MHAGVTLANGFAPTLAELTPGIIVFEQILDFRAHAVAVRNAKIILPGTE
jgi:hypothetical protein